MKKKLSLLVIFAFMLMGAAACKQPAGNEKTENTPGESEEIEVKNIEYGTEESLLEGKKLEQLTVTGTDDAFNCNLEENIKWIDLEAAPVLVCKDPVYDITYYINYGRDYYIYAYRNGVAELVVEIPAKDLFCKEGELYFIADTYGRYQFSDFAEGNVLKYNPKDGSVAVVVDCSADRMIVYQDGICYEQRGAVKRFFFSFATGECSPLPKDSDNLRRWNGCWIDERYEVVEASEDFLAENEELMQEISELGYTFAGVSGSLKSINLVDIQGNVTETLQNVEGISKEYWISGDSAYYVEQRENDIYFNSQNNIHKFQIPFFKCYHKNFIFQN